ncbi:hypothetical protein [Fusobacterium russii]|uniref:hypothetical protein n=1 Tax=Fusobacterium russii TaxID=854 RepID=UPI0003A7571E|nr:hypothetical protein [Fusobacterium russii]
MTSDSGKVFSCFKEVDKLRINFYFVAVYNTVQKGVNKNSNELLKRFHPNKIDLSKVEEKKLKEFYICQIQDLGNI